MTDRKYPKAFITKAGCLFMKRPFEVSNDGTPRYVPNKNADATYSLDDCMKDYYPIYSLKL